MGTNNIPAAVDSTVIPADHHNKIRTALIGDHVPRNSSANAEDDSGSLGQSAFRWLQGFIKTVFIGEVADNISLSSNGAGDLNLSVGGNVRAIFREAHMFLPPAMIVPYAGSGDVGVEWLLCDGREVSRITYSRLFAAIGITHGQGNTTTTFNLPDYRGRFLRGTDNMGTGAGAAGRDPDTASRTAMAAGGTTGNNVGSIQADQYKSHTHALNENRIQTIVSGDLPSGFSHVGGGSEGYTTITQTAMGGNETRPLNAYTNFLIKT